MGKYGETEEVCFQAREPTFANANVCPLNCHWPPRRERPLLPSGYCSACAIFGGAPPPSTANLARAMRQRRRGP